MLLGVAFWELFVAFSNYIFININYYTLRYPFWSKMGSDTAEVASRHRGEHHSAPRGTAERWKRAASLCRVRAEREGWGEEKKEVRERGERVERW